MDFRPPANTFKGDGPIIILGLLKDDDADREMGRMTDLLEKRTISCGRKGARIDCKNSLNQCKFSGGTTLYVTGHCRFMEATTKPRPVPDRTLGGFKLDDMVEVLYKAICSGVVEIEFWCCESACKNGTKQLNGNSSGTAVQPFRLSAFQIVPEKFETACWFDISTLDYICYKLVLHAQKQKRPFDSYPTVRITGLNGVGYITEDDGYITTFDQGLMLAEYNKILGLEKDIRENRVGTHTKKNLEQADGRLRRHIATRSCHFITVELNFPSLVAEAQALNRFLRNQKQNLPLPSKIPANVLQQMDQTLGPLLRRQ